MGLAGSANLCALRAAALHLLPSEQIVQVHGDLRLRPLEAARVTQPSHLGLCRTNV
jgi:hypothetical protein